MILIDKAEVMEAVQADMDVSVTGRENMENVARMMRDILSTISDSPEVEVIQCKDCKHWQCDDSESYCDELGIFGTSPTSYCSFARRKEE